MLNVIILTGRLTKEPTSIELDPESRIANFDIAVDNLGKDAGTTFITCKAFQKVADNVVKHLHKGSKVAVNGRLQQRTYLAKDGTKRSVYEVLCDSVEFLDPRPAEEKEPDVSNIAEELSENEDESPKFDPYTGKPLKESAKKK